jgi:hypothetical protein
VAPHKPTLYLKLSTKNQVLHTVAYTLYGEGDHAPPAGGVREPGADVGLHTGQGATHPAACGEVVHCVRFAVAVRTTLLRGCARRRKALKGGPYARADTRGPVRSGRFTSHRSIPVFIHAT